MAGLTLRPVRLSDAPQITDLWNALIRDTTVTFESVEKTQAQVENLISDRGDAFFVAEQAGRIEGYASFGPFRGGTGYAQTCEHSVLLRPDVRGQGLGRALMHKVETQARAAGMHIMVAGVSGENTAGVAFHAALGFTKVGHMQAVGHKFGRWLDLILMQKSL